METIGENAQMIFFFNFIIFYIQRYTLKRNLKNITFYKRIRFVISDRPYRLAFHTVICKCSKLWKKNIKSVFYNKNADLLKMAPG